MNWVGKGAKALARYVRRFGDLAQKDRSAHHWAVSGLEGEERGRLVRRILSTLHNNSILLCGRPGTGKTAIPLHLK